MYPSSQARLDVDHVGHLGHVDVDNVHVFAKQFRKHDETLSAKGQTDLVDPQSWGPTIRLHAVQTKSSSLALASHRNQFSASSHYLHVLSCRIRFSEIGIWQKTREYRNG